MDGEPETQSALLPPDKKKPVVVEVPAEKVRDILTGLPVEQQKEIALLFRQSVLAKSHRGPLPTPEDLEKYCALIPNGGERIMARHEKQSDHRMELERFTVRAQMKQSNLGQFMGFILGLLGLGISGFCIWSGHDVAGATLGGTTLVGLVSVFVAGKTEIWKSLLQKRPHSSENSEADTVEANRQIQLQKEPPNPRVESKPV